MTFARVGGITANRPHSLPGYHAAYVALWAALPALLFVAIWAGLAPRLITTDVLASPAAVSLPADQMERNTILAEARALANGRIAVAFNPAAEGLSPAFAAARTHYGIIGLAITIMLALAGGTYAFM